MRGVGQRRIRRGDRRTGGARRGRQGRAEKGRAGEEFEWGGRGRVRRGGPGGVIKDRGTGELRGDRGTHMVHLIRMDIYACQATKCRLCASPKTAISAITGLLNDLMTPNHKPIQHGCIFTARTTETLTEARKLVP